MLRLFNHHISLRAVVYATIELLAFIAAFNIFRLAALAIFFPGVADTYGNAYLLPIFCLTAFVVASAFGLYNKELCADPVRAIPRLLTAAGLMYGLMAFTISVAEVSIDGTPHLRVYYGIALSSVVAYFFMAVLFRLKIFAANVNSTLLERRVLVLGVGACAAKIEDSTGQSRSPYKVVGFLPVGQDMRSNRLAFYKVLPQDVLLRPGGLRAQARELRADEIVVTSRDRRNLPLEALMECKLDGIAVTEFADFWERQTGQIDLEELSPSWIVFSEGFGASWVLALAKRGVDLSLSALLVVLTLPLTVLAAAAIKLEDGGSIFYSQERVGQNGAVFNIFKFRTMRSDAERNGAQWALRNDARITAVGRFLRRTRIDEIPQVLNVLRGQMSFVGPRPERPVFVDTLAQKIPHYNVRHNIKPGITGWAQINYPYGASDDDARAKLAYDLYYTKNSGFFLDTVILLQTVSAVLWPIGVR